MLLGSSVVLGGFHGWLWLWFCVCFWLLDRAKGQLEKLEHFPFVLFLPPLAHPITHLFLGLGLSLPPPPLYIMTDRCHVMTYNVLNTSCAGSGAGSNPSGVGQPEVKPQFDYSLTQWHILKNVT